MVVFDLEGRQALKLEEVIKIRSRLAAIRKLPKGATIGYGRSCELTKPTVVGTPRLDTPTAYHCTLAKMDI